MKMATVALRRPKKFLRLLLENQKFTIGMVIFLTLFVLAIFANFFIETGKRTSGSLTPRQPPGETALLGSDSLGRSIASQMGEAVPNSLQVGLIAAFLGTTIGALIGFSSGYFGGVVDGVLRILIDVFLSVPSLLFLILIASLLRGVSVQVMAIIIGLFAWAWPARQVRAQVLSLKERGFVQVSRLSGMSGLEIIFRELMPHMLPWLGANFVNAFIAAILAESGLSILGLGPQREMTLGMMIYWALSYGALLQNQWWWWFIPVITLMALFLALYLIHIGLEEVSNPRLRQQGA
ncbi:MAG: ABC transporter permease [Chloroflexi bacterium]|nr:MAG: ABC transporter permease [Chloroflexota bacterium]